MTFYEHSNRDSNCNIDKENPETLNVCVRFFFFYVQCWGTDKLQEKKDELIKALKFSETLARAPYTDFNWLRPEIKDHRNMLLLAWGIGSPCSLCLSVHPINGIGCTPEIADETRLRAIFGEGKNRCSRCDEDIAEFA